MLSAALVFAHSTHQTAPPASLIPKIVNQDKTMVVTVEDAPFATVYFDRDAKPYVYPVHGPSGLPMTRNFPMLPDHPGEPKDHPHHRSLWFAHGDINGADFWHEGDNMGKFRLKSADYTSTSSPSVILEGELYNAEGTLANVTFHYSFGAAKTFRTIDLTTTITPSQTRLVFGDTKEGTFGIRVRPELQLTGPQAKGQIINSEGHTDAQAWGKRARWVSYSGPVESQTVGIAVFDHPRNHAHPTWWHARDYGLLSANPFGRRDFESPQSPSGAHTLNTGESLVLRYRVLLFNGPSDPAFLDQQFSEFSKTP